MQMQTMTTLTEQLIEQNLAAATVLSQSYREDGTVSAIDVAVEKGKDEYVECKTDGFIVRINAPKGRALLIAVHL